MSPYRTPSPPTEPRVPLAARVLAWLGEWGGVLFFGALMILVIVFALVGDANDREHAAAQDAWFARCGATCHAWVIDCNKTTKYGECLSRAERFWP